MDIKIKNRHRLKIKEIKKLLNELQEIFKCDLFTEKSTIETGEYDGLKMIFIDQIPSFIYHNDKILFTLFGIHKYKPKNNYVVVDMGAVKFVTNGADVMTPGIVDADINIEKDEQVWICDEKNHKALAIGIAKIPGEEMIKKEKGKAIKIINYVGDNLWISFAKSL